MTVNGKPKRRKTKLNKDKTFVTEDMAQVEMPWHKDTQFRSVYKNKDGRFGDAPFDNLYVNKTWADGADTIYVIVVTEPMFNTQAELEEYVIND